jgi:hypothetical protein
LTQLVLLIGNGVKNTIGLLLLGNQETVVLLYNFVTLVIHLIGSVVQLKLLMSYLNCFSQYQIGLVKMSVDLMVLLGTNILVKIMLNHLK